MRTVSFEYLLKHVQSMRLGQSELPAAGEYAAVRGWLDLSLGECWESEEWPELLRHEKRYFRPIWDEAATYAAGDQVFYPVTQKYYLSCEGSNTGNAPATGTPPAENSDYWTELKTAYTGASWVATSGYQIGDIVYQPNDDTYYFMHVPDVSTVPGNNEPPDAAFWIALPPLDRYVALDQAGKTAIGEVFDARTADARVTTSWKPVPWELGANGVQVLDDRAEVWLKFRIRRPALKGDNFDAALTYAIGDQVYFTPAGGEGNLYDCVSATSAGESPSSAAAKWTRVELPYIFAGYLVWSAFAKSLVGEGQHGKQRQASLTAEGYLQLEADKLFRQQQQARHMAVSTY